MAKVIKCKIESNCSTKDIAMKLGEVCYVSMNSDDGKPITKKKDLIDYYKRNGIEVEYLSKHGNDFSIVDQKVDGDLKVFVLSTVSKAKVSAELSKIRSNENGVLSDIIGREVPRRLVNF
jgi:hypothetical protein